MHVSSVVVWLSLTPCRNLRDKETRAQRIMDKLRTHFNVSLVFLGPDDASDMAALGIAAAGRGKREARAVLEEVVDAMAVHPEAQIVGDPEWR